MKRSLLSWFNNVSIKNKFYFIVGIMLFLIALELTTLYTMVYLLSAGRAYVGGEGLWSKGEKDATIYLLKYANTHNEEDYQKFLSFISVTVGDKKARIELQKPRPNMQIAYQGFLQGRNQPPDIPGLINLFYWFQYQSHLRQAAVYWIEADSLIQPLLEIGSNLHQKIVTNTLTAAEYNQFINQIYQLNSEITQLADNFSYALGDASRWLENVVLRTVLTIAIIVELSGLLLTIFVTFNIRRGIDEIIRVSNKIKQMDFSERAKLYANDEIGHLANSFNRMTEDLKANIYKKNNEIIARKKQEKLLTTRNLITEIMVENFTLEDAIPKILKLICESWHLLYGALWQINKKNNVIYCTHVWTTSDENIKNFAKKSKNLTFNIGSVLPGKAWELQKPYVIKDFSADPNFLRLELTNKAGLRSGFAIPIIFENEIFGILEFFTDYFSSITLDDNFMQTLNEICNMMGIFIQREHAQKKAASLSRQAGMAEVASNVLHNVGNSLNSINTSIAILCEKNSHSKMASLIELDKLLQQHKDNIENFLSKDEKGKNILQFISLLSNEWHKEHQFFTDELNSLTKNVSHVKNIIMIQQSFGQTFIGAEEISLNEMIDEAIALNKHLLKESGINIDLDYSPIKRIVINKDKLFQIIVNIVKNCIESLLESNQPDKNLLINLKEKDSNHFMLQFIDNGVGISPENISKIFAHGFTTKISGHGFGLHNSAIYANELGGNLSAESEGPGCGATFTLILPYKPVSRGRNH